MTPYFKAQKLADDPKAFSAALAYYEPSLEAVLPTLHMPCLVCVGEGGDSYDEAKRCAGQLPNGRFRSFPGLNHGQMLRYSHLVTPHVKEFLDAVTPQAEKNRLVIDGLIQALNRGNFLALEGFYTSDWVCLLPDRDGDGKGIRKVVDALFNMFRDAEVVLHDVSVENHQVKTRWTFKGTHTGECMGIAPTNARVKISGVTVDSLQDGKIIKSQFSYDLAEFQRQLTSKSVESH